MPLGAQMRAGQGRQVRAGTVLGAVCAYLWPMLTASEKGYLALTLAFLAAGSGLKAYRQSSVRIGPFADRSFLAASAADPTSAAQGVSASDSLTGVIGDSAAPALPDSSRSDPAGPAAHVNESSKEGAAGQKPAFAGKVDLNRAGTAELTRVKGIGAKTASAIVEYRKSRGPFRSIRDLLQVKGIGEKKLEKLSPFLIL